MTAPEDTIREQYLGKGAIKRPQVHWAGMVVLGGLNVLAIFAMGFMVLALLLSMLVGAFRPDRMMPTFAVLSLWLITLLPIWGIYRFAVEAKVASMARLTLYTALNLTPPVICLIVIKVHQVFL